MKTLAIACLLVSSAVFAQPTPEDTVIQNHHENIMAFLESRSTDDSARLTLARVASEYRLNRIARSNYEAYLMSRPKDGSVRIEYAIVLVKDSATRTEAWTEASMAMSNSKSNIKVLAGALTVALFRLDSDRLNGNYDELRSNVENTARQLLSVSTDRDKYHQWFADSVLRFIKHYNDSQGDLNLQADQDLGKVVDDLKNVSSTILLDYADDPVFIKYFKKTEKAWKAYRDAEMLMLYPYSNTDSCQAIYGSVFPMCYSLRVADLERERLKDIMVWYNGEEPEMDVCQGSVMSTTELQEIRNARRTANKKQ